jgi:predicted  nucleic acid-binding Zn-ribbon protein
MSSVQNSSDLPSEAVRFAVLEHRVGQLEERHETVPTRVTKLEGQFEHMAGQLTDLNDGQRKLTATVSDIGGKVARALTILTVLGTVAQMVAPTLLKAIFP